MAASRSASSAVSRDLFRTPDFEIRDGGELLGVAFFGVVSAVGHSFAPRASGFWIEQNDLENGKVWNVTPCRWFADFDAACRAALADAGVPAPV